MTNRFLKSWGVTMKLLPLELEADTFESSVNLNFSWDGGKIIVRGILQTLLLLLLLQLLHPCFSVSKKINTCTSSVMFLLGHVFVQFLYYLWCLLATDDQVYMDNEKSLEEYVLSQDGIIFRGSSKHPIATPWNFGQVPTPTLTLSVSLHHTQQGKFGSCFFNMGKYLLVRWFIMLQMTLYLQPLCSSFFLTNKTLWAHFST